MILNEIGIIGHGNDIHSRANKNFDETIDENTAYTNFGVLTR